MIQCVGVEETGDVVTRSRKDDRNGEPEKCTYGYKLKERIYMISLHVIEKYTY